MPNPFEKFQLTPKQEKEIYDKNPNPNPFETMKMEESWGKSVLRSLLQIPSGIGQAMTYPLDIISAVGTGESFDPEEIEHLEKISKREGIPFDKEKYMQAIKGASEAFPTQSNIEKLVEEKTGIPLEAKTNFQKGIKLASTAGKLSPGSLTQKGVAAVTAPSVSTGLKEIGVPETLSDIGGLVAAGGASAITPAATIEKVTKPSGMTTKRFEGLTKPVKVSEARHTKISESIEKDFRGIADKLLEEAPVGKTASAMKEDSAFKSKIGELFQDVEKLSEDIPNKFSTNLIKKQIADKRNAKKSPGFTEGEFEQAYKKNMSKFLKDTPAKQITSKDLVAQYRANNKALGELYEPSKSPGFNRAKKEALLDYNKIIADTIESGFPDSEFSKLFKFSNKKWSEIKDVEAINAFMDDLFKGKVRYEKGEKFFKKHNLETTFKRALGEENFPKFKTLMNDLMSTKEAYSLIKKAQDKGMGDWTKNGIAYLVNPKIMAGKVGLDVARKSYKALLDKPKLTIVWSDAIKDAKKGNFSAAQAKFELLNKEINQIEDQELYKK